MSINNKFQPLYIANDSSVTTVENVSSNLQFCEVNNSINTISAPTIINQNINEDLNLSAFNGSTINPIIKINNTHQHVNITSNLNVASNLNVTSNLNVKNIISPEGNLLNFDHSKYLADNHTGVIIGEINTTQSLTNTENNPIIANFAIGGENKSINLIVIGNIETSGNIYCTALTQSSDDRLKINEVPITNAIDTINKLQPEFYTKISQINPSLNILESGLIAQDLYNNVPELRHLVDISEDALNNPVNFDTNNKLIENVVNTNGNNEYLHLNYTGIIPYLIGAVKEMSAKINNLETELNNLKSQ